MARPRPPARRRAAAWVVTGPAGHLYGGVADWAALVGRHLLARPRAKRSRAARRDRGASHRRGAG